jgi:hypothetical protein
MDAVIRVSMKPGEDEVGGGAAVQLLGAPRRRADDQGAATWSQCTYTCVVELVEPGGPIGVGGESAYRAAGGFLIPVGHGFSPY